MHIIYLCSVTLCCQVWVINFFRIIWFIHLWNVSEEGGSILQRNIRNNLSDYTVSKPRKPTASYLWQISHVISPFQTTRLELRSFLVFSFMLYALLPFPSFAVTIDYPVKSKNHESPLQTVLCILSQVQTLTTDNLLKASNRANCLEYAWTATMVYPRHSFECTSGLAE
jgi:hypothetical protein